MLLGTVGGGEPRLQFQYLKLSPGIKLCNWGEPQSLVNLALCRLAGINTDVRITAGRKLLSVAISVLPHLCRNGQYN